MDISCSGSGPGVEVEEASDGLGAGCSAGLFTDTESAECEYVPELKRDFGSNFVSAVEGQLCC